MTGRLLITAHSLRLLLDGFMVERDIPIQMVAARLVRVFVMWDCWVASIVLAPLLIYI